MNAVFLSNCLTCCKIAIKTVSLTYPNSTEFAHSKIMVHKYLLQTGVLVGEPVLFLKLAFKK
jgi:hypothetical protein